MSKPGIEPTGTQQGPKQETASGKPLGWKKIFAAAAVVGAGALLLNQCQGDIGTTPPGATPVAAPPFDPTGLYYVVLEDGPLRNAPGDTPRTDRFIQKGSCVQGIRDNTGEQESARRTYHVTMREANGADSSAYIHMGNLAAVHPARVSQGCIATFKAEYTQRAQPVAPPVPTYTNGGSTINIRSAPDADMEVWATLAPNSCLVPTGQNLNNMMQVKLDAPQSNQNTYKWVRIRDVQLTDVPAGQCRANYTVGAPPAGTTPNPWN